MEVKIKEHLKSLGCNDFIKISLAHQLYLELCEVRTMYDVQFSYNKSLDIVYLTAKPSSKCERLVYVPYSTSSPINMRSIDELQKTLCKGDILSQCLTLACIEGDSTVVLYSFTPGLVSVDNPDSLVRQKTREQRRDFTEGEIKKNRLKILSKAFESGVTELDE